MKVNKINKILCFMLATSIASPSLAGFKLSWPEWLSLASIKKINADKVKSALTSKPACWIYGGIGLVALTLLVIKFWPKNKIQDKPKDDEKKKALNRKEIDTKKKKIQKQIKENKKEKLGLQKKYPSASKNTTTSKEPKNNLTEKLIQNNKKEKRKLQKELKTLRTYTTDKEQIENTRAELNKQKSLNKKLKRKKRIQKNKVPINM